MKEPRDHKLYVEDILTAIDRILEYTQDCDFTAFKRDYRTVDAVVRNFGIIGEATKNIPQEIKAAHSHVPWNEMYSLRNRISHAYFGVDYEIVWDIIVNYLPENRTQIEAIRRVMQAENL